MQWCCVATRYDRIPANFLASVLISCILIWLNVDLAKSSSRTTAMPTSPPRRGRSLDNWAFGRSIHLCCSPPSNGMAESLVNTFKRDYVGRTDLADARMVMTQMGTAFEHFNEVHPLSALEMRSLKEFRQYRAAQQRLAQFEQALHRE